MKKTVFLILLLMVFGLSCRKITNTQPPFTSVSFPLAVGNWWQYTLTQIGSVPDTFILTIVSTAKVGYYVQYNCNTSSRYGSGPIGYFQVSDTSLSFVNTIVNSYNSAIWNFYLRLPASAGSHWPGMFADPKDSIVVDGVVDHCSGPQAPSVGPCYFLSENYTSPVNFVADGMTLVPKIGLTEQSISFSGDTLGQVKHQLTLLNYSVQ